MLITNMTRGKPKIYIEYLKKKRKEKQGKKVIFFGNLWKMFVSDTPCP